MNDIITFDTEKLSGTKFYPPYDLVPETFPILKQKALPFDFDKEDAEEISKRLQATLLKTKAFGVAAPQCNIPYRVFCMGAENEYFTLFNPEIISVSDETNVLEEGCLSFVGLVLNIVRPREITIKYQNENREEIILTLSGLSARIAYHEIDHLEGITFDTRAKPLALKQGQKKREKQMKRYARSIAIQRKIQNEKSR
jgi:peptide deformylase